MYRPHAFREDRPEVLHQAMREIGAAAIVSQGADGMVSTHAPIDLQRQPSPYGTIRFHLAKANPQAEAIKVDGEVLFIFQGPQLYVTPAWYPTKQLTGKVVPTWNYVAIHAYGRAEVIDDIAALKDHLTSLTGWFESAHHVPWTLDDAPSSFIDSMCKALVGFEVRLSRIEGMWKMSQNKAVLDRNGVIKGLRARGDHDSVVMADLVEARAPKP